MSNICLVIVVRVDLEEQNVSVATGEVSVSLVSTPFGMISGQTQVYY